MNITINVTKSTDDYGDEDGRADVEVLADGAPVAAGRIGGEPEDNQIGRDYRWVVPALEALAKACGATVTVKEGV